MINKIESSNPREAAFLSILFYRREEIFLSVTLNQWQKNTNPSEKNFSLAREIAYGSVRYMLTLDYLAKQITEKKLSLKNKERALLHTALYQYYFMNKVPLYAINNESVSIARKFCHSRYTAFLNAILRKLPKINLTLPKGNTCEEMSISYSYPTFFVKELVKSYGIPQAKKIMLAGNRPSQTTVRLRSPHLIKNCPLPLVTTSPFPMATIEKQNNLQVFSSSKDYYIQNITTATLIGLLCEQMDFEPQHILDLCASPGGKTLAVHDFFPKANLYSNDINEDKVHRLLENLNKYHIQAHTSICRGENFKSSKKFNIVIGDVPCSNSGVLNKRPEARWRLSKSSLKDLKNTQQAIAQNALNLLKDKGQFWYMTCSILKSENEFFVEKLCQDFNLHKRFSKTIFPSIDRDGGFCCSLEKLTS